jgi:arylsulfatase A
MPAMPFTISPTPMLSSSARWLFLLAPLILGLMVPAASFGATRQRPNIVIILADDMGYADVGAFGGDRFPTPHLDALAQRGLKLTDFHSNAPVCSPTRAAFLTGRYQHRSGIDEVVLADPKLGMRDTHGLSPSEPTFASLLKGAGYRTALMGKWHLGYAEKFNPMHHGFDEFRGYVSGNVDFHSHLDGTGAADWWHNLELRDEPGYSTHLISRHAVRFIEENQSHPFCLYVAHEAPHSPYQGPNDPPVRGPAAAKPLSGADVSRAYAEMVQEMDKGIGEIVATLDRLGLADDTLVFFFSDNGATAEGNNGNLRGTKGTLWEGGHRVPAIAAWPGRIKPGGVSDQTAIGMDLLPTLLDLSGTPSPKDHPLDGVSLARLLLAKEPLPERTLFWGYGHRFAVRRGPWKLVASPPRAPGVNVRRRAGANEPTVGLYHLGNDPSESINLADVHPALVLEFQAALDHWRQDVGYSKAR